MRPRPLVLAIALTLLGCAQERPLKPVIANPLRLPKSLFADTYVYLKSVTDVKYPGNRFGDIPAGWYLDSDKLVQFVVREKSLDVVAIDPLFQKTRDAQQNAVLASIPVRHVDILRKQNPDGRDTNEEEETESRRVWRDRQYLVLDPAGDTLDPYAKETKTADGPVTIDIDREKGAINFEVTRQLSDDTLVRERYSFLRFTPSSTYRQREYPKELQERFGFFKTTTYRFDRLGRIATTDRREFMNRWDISRPVVFYLSKDYPAHLKGIAYGVFNAWNDAVRAAIGRDLFVLKDNSGQELGDLRYNVIHYDPSPESTHGILGYAPGVTNPRTGEIVKSDVVLYGGTLRRALHREEIFQELLGGSRPYSGPPDQAVPPSGLDDTPSFSRPTIGALFPKNFAFAIASPPAVPLKPAEPESMALLHHVEGDMSPLKLVRALRAQARSELDRRITRSDGFDVTGVKKKGDSFEAVEAQVFRPLLAHETGHAIGLRHNFKASADKAHAKEPAKTTSVMDYAFLSTHEPATIGPYDFAAVKVLYGSPDVAEAMLDQNYLFCTDENLFDSRDAFCNQYDAGTTLTEIVRNQINRYFASYPFNNYRLGRVHFPDDLGSYLKRVGGLLVPLRLIYDHANAIVQAARNRSDKELWYLLRERIEAGPDAERDHHAVRTVEVFAPTEIKPQDGNLRFRHPTTTRQIDAVKIEEAVKDAEQAKLQAFLALAKVVRLPDSEERPDQDSDDLVPEDLQRRGVLPDKLMALKLLTARMPDPLPAPESLAHERRSVTLFGTLDLGLSQQEKGVGNEFLATILSNTLPVCNAETQVCPLRAPNAEHPFDFAIRELALKGLMTDLASYGESSVLKELIGMTETAVDMELMRKKMQLKERLRARDALGEARRERREKLLENSAAKQMVATWAQAPIPLNLTELLDWNRIEMYQKQWALDEKELEKLEAGLSPEALREESILFRHEDLRTKLQAVIKRFHMTDLSPQEVADAQGRMLEIIAATRQLNVAYVELPGESRQLKASLYLPKYGFNTASGYLLHYNINYWENLWSALSSVLNETTDPAMRRALLAKIDAYRRWAAAERDFAKRLRLCYEGRASDCL